MRDAAWTWRAEVPPLELPLEAIRVPLPYVSAAGGFGQAGRYSTPRVGSTNVTVLVVHTGPVGGRARDMGHADLRFGRDADLRV